ncbi:RDD family protein [Paenibacillus foliorum]|nr:RDD family protein [Paenibacillus foliorum]
MTRLGAFFIDHLLFSIVTTIFYFLISWDIMTQSPMSVENFNKLRKLNYSVTAIALIITMFKDVVKGRSIGKRITNIAVIDRKRIDQVPSTWRLILRNITLLIWPVELIYFLISGKRIGDIIFNTEVVGVKVKAKEER